MRLDAGGAGPAVPGPTVLGVERSVLGRRWEERLADGRAGLAIAQRYGLPEMLGRVLAGRNVALEEVDSYLAPTLRASLPDPSGFIDMESAVARIVRALDAGEKVAVFGDYDVDGATSSALLVRFFRSLGRELTVYIPDRVREGYGPNAPALERLKAAGVDLVVTVDCGVGAHEALGRAREIGLDVIVVDHHEAEPGLPPAVAIVNPNRFDETRAHGNLAAVGVTFLLVVAINRALRESGWYARRDIGAPDLLQWLDLVALGTVCDVVPLTGVNRALVAQGLKVLAARRNLGLAALADAGRLDQVPAAFHLGFVYGPRINAGGRVGEPDMGARLLTTEDPEEARRLAASLDAYNRERKEIESAVLEDAVAEIERGGGPGDGLVFAARDGWHPGVIGIVASRLVERYGMPAVVVGLEEGRGKGSGRSVPGVDLGAAVLAARQEGLLINGGGHPMAAGLTVAREQLARLRDFLEARLRVAHAARTARLGLDGMLHLTAVNDDLVSGLEACGPFGAGNAEPRFAFPATRIAKADVVGEHHVRCMLSGPGGARVKAIAFRAMDSDLGPFLLKARRQPIHVAGRVQRDRWLGGSAVQMVIEDAAAP